MIKSTNLAIAVTDYLRKEYLDDHVNYYLSDFSYSIFETGIEACFELYHQSQNTTYLEEAFLLIEKGKTITLKRALLHNDLMENILEQEFRTREKLLKDKLNTLKYATNNEYSDSLVLAQRELALFLDSLESLFPKYRQLKNAITTFSIQEIVQSLPNEQTAILSYYWGEKAVYALLVSSDKILGIKVINIEKVKEISNQLRLIFNNYSIASDAKRQEMEESYSELAYGLYVLLVKPLLEQPKSTINELVIIPDGPLHYIPFEALLRKRPPTDLSFGKMDYLLNDYVVSYYPSASLLHRSFQTKASKRNKYIGFAASYNNTLKLPDPISCNQQIEQTGQLFDGQTYTGLHTSKQQFLQVLPKATILDFSGHAFFDNDATFESGILFSNPRNTIDTLSTQEIYLANTTPDLVFLGACQTGNGLIHKGEGLMNMARAFLIGGSKSLGISLWDAEDFTLAKLKASFFIKVEQNTRLSLALTESKRAFLANEQYRNRHFPALWGSVILVSSPDVYLSSSYSIYGILALGIIVVLGLFFLLILKVS